MTDFDVLGGSARLPDREPDYAPPEQEKTQFDQEVEARERGREDAEEGADLQDNPYLEEPYKSAWTEGWWSVQ